MPPIECWIRLSSVQQLTGNSFIGHANIVEEKINRTRKKLTRDLADGGVEEGSVITDGETDDGASQNGNAAKRQRFDTVSCARYQSAKFRIEGPPPLVASCIPKFLVLITDEKEADDRVDLSLEKYCTNRRTGTGTPRRVTVLRWIKIEWPVAESRYKADAAVAARTAVAMLRKYEAKTVNHPPAESAYKQLAKQLEAQPQLVTESSRFQRAGVFYYFDGIQLAGKGETWGMALDLFKLWGRSEVLHLLENQQLRESLILQLELEPLSVITRAPDANGLIRYWVKCENGNVAVAECLKDQRHCGDRRDQTIAREAVAACDGIGTFTLFKGPKGH